MTNYSRIFLILKLLLSGMLVSCSSDKPVRRTIDTDAKCSKEENKDDSDCKIAGPSVPAGEEEPGEGEDPKEEDPETPGTNLKEDFLVDVKAFSDKEAIDYLKDKCAACHESKSGSVRSFWSLDVDGITKEKLATDTLAYKIYYSTLLRAKDIDAGKPAPMPPNKLKGEALAEHLRFVKWYRAEAPSAVDQANREFGNGVKDSSGGVGVMVNFKCSEPVTFREYIRRVTNDIFGREPTAEELKLNGATPDLKTTAKDRATVSGRIFENEAWKKEFIDFGLKKFANKLAGSNAIEPIEGNLTPAQVEDLREEFYQILKKNFDSKSLKDILLSNKVMVSPETAPLYNCNPPQSGWVECEMPTERKSYFSTISYLASKRSSFLVENNNYGRAALLYFFVRGDVFKPSFNTDGGGETTKPLPSCLKSNDYRGKIIGESFAPNGTNSIPVSANLCQSCHIDRQMATGSIVFRKFNPSGLIYGSQMPLMDDPDYASAKAEDIVNKKEKNVAGTPVDDQFLADLLAGTGEQGCIPGGSGESDVLVNDPKELAAWMIGDGSALSAGLARHVPRAMSNLSNTSEEVILKMNAAYSQGDGKLAPLFRAYFSSETYSCKR